MNRIVSFDKQYRMMLRDERGNWHQGREAERRATKAERVEYQRQLQADEYELPFFDGTNYFYLNGERGLLESDVLIDLVHILRFTEERAHMILETSRLMAKVKAFIDQD